MGLLAAVVPAFHDFAVAEAPTKAAPSTATSPKKVEDPLAAALAKPILGRGDALAALSRYCEDHLPAQPQAKSRRDWLAQAEQLRRRALDDVIFRGRAAEWRDAPARVQWRDTIPGGPGYTIRKFRYEAVPGLWIPALVYMPDKVQGRVPAVLNFHGHAHDDGKAYPPKQVRCINLAKRGIIAMSPEWLWTGQLQNPADYSHERAPQLDLCGASGMAPFYLSMSRAMDILASMEHVDPRRIAVTGLSGGGWQTILFGALDTRPALVAPNAGYASLAVRIDRRESLGDYEQAPCDLAEFCDYTHLTAMVAPRPLLMIYNIRDNCCFAADSTLSPLVAAALPVYRMFDKPRYCQWHVNYDPGTHNYEPDNREAFYRALNDFFLAGDQRLDPTDIPCDGELKSREQLAVELPPGNATFPSLATQLMANLPRDAAPPTEPAARQAWVDRKRAALRNVVRFVELPVQGKLVNETSLPLPSAESSKNGDESTPTMPTETEDLLVRRWQLQLGPHWTAPAVELAPQGDPSETVILMADRGRAATRARAAQLVKNNRRVLVVDPFLVGEQSTHSGFDDQRFAELIQSTGGRVLGISAGQLAAIAQWTRRQYPGSVRLETFGSRTSLVGLVAAALEPRLVDRLQTHQSFDTLKEVVRRNLELVQMPEAFCFGLLEVIDIDQLKAMTHPSSRVPPGEG